MGNKRKEKDYLEHCHSLIILGGTFDPIHMGHLAIAEAASRQLKPQRVLFIPSGKSAHKHDRQITDADHRFNMTAVAVCEHPSFDISRLELNRPGPSYTIDTARALYAICPSGAKISFMIGTDALMDILSWKDAAELLRMCEFVIVPRPGYGKDAAAYIEYLTAAYSARIHWLDGPLLEISSTDIRNRFKAGQTVQGFMPKAAEEYARQHRLYDTSISPQAQNMNAPQTFPCPLTAMFQYEAAKEALRIRLSPKRFTHTLGVVSEAEKLAAHYGQDIEKARCAALLHDCTKEYSADKKRALCRLWGIQLDTVLEANIDLTHSLLGAESARRDFHVRDPQILQAIRYHTTGYRNMTLLDKVINLADYIEPYRTNWGPINEMRKLAYTDINRALILGIEYTLKEDTMAGHSIHPWSRDALKELKEEQNEK